MESTKTRSTSQGTELRSIIMMSEQWSDEDLFKRNSVTASCSSVREDTFKSEPWSDFHGRYQSRDSRKRRRKYNGNGLCIGALFCCFTIAGSIVVEVLLLLIEKAKAIATNEARGATLL